jgi:hypothetical protein
MKKRRTAFARRPFVPVFFSSSTIHFRTRDLSDKVHIRWVARTPVVSSSFSKSVPSDDDDIVEAASCSTAAISDTSTTSSDILPTIAQALVTRQVQLQCREELERLNTQPERSCCW